MTSLPTLTNGGVLVLWLAIVALTGLALLAQHIGRYRCADCGADVGRKPRQCRIGAGEVSPLCRDCFARSVRG